MWVRYGLIIAGAPARSASILMHHAEECQHFQRGARRVKTPRSQRIEIMLVGREPRE